jgi:hypothetical protein
MKYLDGDPYRSLALQGDPGFASREHGADDERMLMQTNECRRGQHEMRVN